MPEKVFSLPPPVPTNNLAQITHLVSTNRLIKLAGYENLYTPVAFPGLLLKAIIRWSDVAHAQGTAAFDMNGRLSFNIEAHAPMSTPRRVLGPTGRMMASMPVVKSQRSIDRYGYERENFSTGFNRRSWRATQATIADESYETTVEMFCVMAVVTGASQGTYYAGQSHSPVSYRNAQNAWTPIQVSRGDWVSLITPTGKYGVLTTGQAMTARQMAVRAKAAVLGDVDASFAAQASAAYDEWIDTAWFRDKMVVLGTTLWLEDSNAAGDVRIFGQGILGGESVLLPDAQSGMPSVLPNGEIHEIIPSPDRAGLYVNTQVEDNRFGKMELLVNSRIKFAQSPKTVYPQPTPTGLSTDVWLKAMLLARDNLQDALTVPPAGTPGEYISPLQELVTTQYSSSPTELDAQFAAKEPQLALTSEAYRLQYLEEDTIQTMDLSPLFENEMKILDAKIRRRILS